MPIHRGYAAKQREEQQQLPVDELVEGAPPHEQQAGETAAGGAGDLVLVRDRHRPR